MIKRFELSNGNILFLGSAREITCFFWNMGKREIALNVFRSYPRFIPDHNYGLIIRNYDPYQEEHLLLNEMSIVSVDMAIDILLHDIDISLYDM